MALLAVRPPGSGSGAQDGSDWNNALNGMPTTFVRGNSYYQAAGSYPGDAFDTANSGTTPITIKKATDADHGPADGWQSGFGSGQVNFTSLCTIQTSYWNFLFGSSVGTYGLRHALSGAPPFFWRIGVSGDQVTEIAMEGIDVDGTDTTDGAGFSGYMDVIRFTNCRLGLLDTDAFKINNSTDVIIEYCFVDRRNPASAGHADAISFSNKFSSLIFRHNVVDWNGQQLWMDDAAPATYDALDIYGNVFTNSVTASPPASNDAIKSSGGATVGVIKNYNNTFAGIWTAHSQTGPAGSEIRNNLYYDLGTSVGFGVADHSHNWFGPAVSHDAEATGQTGSGDPFVDYANEDFRLAQATEAGFSLGSPYNVDRFGITRGADGVWDRGAWEFQAAAAHRSTVFVI